MLRASGRSPHEIIQQGFDNLLRSRRTRPPTIPMLPVPAPFRDRPLAIVEPACLLVDSVGLKLCITGEQLLEKHGMRTRRSWRKLHMNVDADTHQVLN